MPMTPLSSQDLEALKALAEKAEADHLRLANTNMEISLADWAHISVRLLELRSALPRLLSHITALEAEKAEAEKERDKAIRSRDFTVQWYAERLEPIKDVAKRVGVWPEVAAIIANGSGTRQLEDGSFKYEPPTYAQQLNMAFHKAERATKKAAEARRLALDEAEQAMRAIYNEMPDDKFEDTSPDDLLELQSAAIIALKERT